MSDTHHHRETVYETDDHAVAPASASLLTFAVLVVLAGVALAVGFSNLGPWKVAVSLLIAAVQAGVLTLFFMDLKQADKLTWLVAGAGLLWVGIMFLLILTDYVTRHLAAY